MSKSRFQNKVQNISNQGGKRLVLRNYKILMKEIKDDRNRWKDI